MQHVNNTADSETFLSVK